MNRLGTVVGPKEFDAEAAAKRLYEGMKGLGTDESALACVIGIHTNEQRQEIKEKYKTMYGEELDDNIQSELGGSFSKLVLALLKQPEEYLIECVHQAIDGLGTDEGTLIGILCTRTNDELTAMKEAYKEKYEKEMEEDIAEDLSGDLKNLIIGFMNAGRDESEEVDAEKVEEDAKELLEAGEGAGTREESFSAIFNQRSPAHMKAVFDKFKEISEKEIEDHIDSEFSGTIQKAYLTFIKMIRSPTEYFAEQINQAIKGAGTDDDTLIQLIVTRSEIDMKDIAAAYEEAHEKKLSEAVASDTSGDYRKLLICLLEGDSENEKTDAPEAEEGQEDNTEEKDEGEEKTDEQEEVKEEEANIEEKAEDQEEPVAAEESEAAQEEESEVAANEEEQDAENQVEE